MRRKREKEEGTEVGAKGERKILFANEISSVPRAEWKKERTMRSVKRLGPGRRSEQTDLPHELPCLLSGSPPPIISSRPASAI